jgi:hypothetical protein
VLWGDDSTVPGWLANRNIPARPFTSDSELWCEIILVGSKPTGMLDYTFYRELIPHRVWTGLDAPEEALAGANNTSFGY